MPQFRIGQRVRVTVGNLAAGRITSQPMPLARTPGLAYAVELDQGEWLPAAGIHVSTILVSACNLTAEEAEAAPKRRPVPQLQSA